MKIRAILTIVISLLIGFVLGYLSSGQVMKHEMEKRRKHSYQDMFVFRTLGVIHPTETQKDSIMPIIKDYAGKAVILKNKVSGEFDSLMNRMNMELKPLLTSDQFKMLEEINERQGKRAPR